MTRSARSNIASDPSFVSVLQEIFKLRTALIWADIEENYSVARSVVFGLFTLCTARMWNVEIRVGNTVGADNLVLNATVDLTTVLYAVNDAFLEICEIISSAYHRWRISTTGTLVLCSAAQQAVRRGSKRRLRLLQKKIKFSNDSKKRGLWTLLPCARTYWALVFQASWLFRFQATREHTSRSV